MGDEPEDPKAGTDDPQKRGSGWITVWVALIAAVAPTTTAIHGCETKNREMALAEGKQAHDIRIAYLDRAIDPNRKPADRLVVLRFLEAVSEQHDPIHQWAQAEQKTVQKEFETLQKEKDDALAMAKARDEEAKKAKVEVKRLRAEKGADVTALKEQTERAERAERERDAARLKASAIDKFISPVPASALGAPLGFPLGGSLGIAACAVDTAKPTGTGETPEISDKMVVACKSSENTGTNNQQGIGLRTWETVAYEIAGRPITIKCQCLTPNRF